MTKLKNKLVISLGTNIGSRYANLVNARNQIERAFLITEASQIVESEAVDYLNQPKFLNQILVLKNINNLKPLEVLSTCMAIEKLMGRARIIDKGPRVIDIDILFFENTKCNDPNLTLPHPRLFERSFIVKPLSTLNIFNDLTKLYQFEKNFSNTCLEYSHNE
jgi:2-amino-4-hydroxy-6-hydroxymethyldihydropteridine diphosphokinase